MNTKKPPKNPITTTTKTTRKLHSPQNPHKTHHWEVILSLLGILALKGCWLIWNPSFINFMWCFHELYVSALPKSPMGRSRLKWIVSIDNSVNILKLLLWGWHCHLLEEFSWIIWLRNCGNCIFLSDQLINATPRIHSTAIYLHVLPQLWCRSYSSVINMFVLKLHVMYKRAQTLNMCKEKKVNKIAAVCLSTSLW